MFPMFSTNIFILLRLKQLSFFNTLFKKKNI